MERRQHQRTAVSHPVFFICTDSKGREKAQDIAVIKDISPDGMLIETAVPIHATDIKILASTGDDKWVEAEGIVIYSMQTAAETFRTGIGFQGPPQKSKQFVTSILGANRSGH